MALPYEVAARKGFRLIQDFGPKKPGKPLNEQSEWIDYGELAKCGWEIDFYDPENGAPRREELDMIKMYNDLGISVAKSENLRIRWTHMNWGHHKGVGYAPTDAFYMCVYNRRAIIAQQSESPKYTAIDHGLACNQLIPLQHWSDIVFLQWQQYCREKGTRMSGLRYIFQSIVTNDDTIKVVYEALAQTGWDIRPWTNPPRDPGARTFHFGCKQFNAIMATPNGVGPVHLLTQHKAAFGNLTITDVTAFIRPGAVNPPLNLCFHVKPWQ